jgi:hypothetical protein
MYNTDTELLFPSRIISDLRDHRGKAWRNLIDRILEQESTSLDRLAFVLMMARLDGCTTCNADSFRAMRGCTQCALQNIRRFRGNDKELIKMFNKARSDLELFNYRTQTESKMSYVEKDK